MVIYFYIVKADVLGSNVAHVKKKKLQLKKYYLLYLSFSNEMISHYNRLR